VNITKTGAYNISTNISNGFQFAADGTFSQLGLQKLVLKAAGSPILDTLTFFNCNFNNSVCAFSVPVKTDTVRVQLPPVRVDTMELNTWIFTDSTDGTIHRGIIDIPSTSFNSTINANSLTIIGWPGSHSSHTLDTIFGIGLFFPHAKIETGTYSITAGVNGTNAFYFSNNTTIPNAGPQSYFYFYTSTAYKNPDFTFTIQSFDPVMQLVKGEFGGSSQRRKEYADYVGALHHIHGEFYLQLH
jgi:hypothetical protein